VARFGGQSSSFLHPVRPAGGTIAGLWWAVVGPSGSPRSTRMHSHQSFWVCAPGASRSGGRNVRTRACRNEIARTWTQTCTIPCSLTRRGGSHGGAGRRACALPPDLELGPPPAVDGLGLAGLLDPRRPLPAIGIPVSGAVEVVADRPFGDAEESAPSGTATGLAAARPRLS
jgi:hypothetical protein